MRYSVEEIKFVEQKAYNIGYRDGFLKGQKEGLKIAINIFAEKTTPKFIITYEDKEKFEKSVKRINNDKQSNIHSRIAQKKREYEDRTGREPKTLYIINDIYLELKREIMEGLLPILPLEIGIPKGDLYYTGLRVYVSDEIKDIYVTDKEENFFE